MSDSAAAAELQQLRRDLLALTERVQVLESRRESEGRLIGSPISPLTVNYFPSSAAGGLPEFPFPGSTTSTEAEGGLRQQLPVAADGGGRDSSGLTERERHQIAVGVGRFFARCLAGHRRGTSGRDQVRLPSTVYVCCKDFSNRVYNPVVVRTSFSALRPLVKPHGDCGDSVFAGFATEWEAKVAVRSAELQWPSDAARH